MIERANNLRRIRQRATGPWITVKEAADYLGVSTDMIYAACATRGLKHAKLGHSTIKLTREWIDEWMESRAKQNPSPKGR